ncbi:MAG: sugar phosphate isomerase (involved in capsule formation) protein [Herbaspirillum sp.]|nr:sugar phosphate isomerase (involved in capsule formation) protein [Herbaspirillum sp.]
MHHNKRTKIQRGNAGKFFALVLVYTARMSVTDDKIQPKAFSAESVRRAIIVACETLQIEADAILAMKQRLAGEAGKPFSEAIALLMDGPSHGRVVVSGMGKSGHIARKIAATFASTGTPALFIHPAEAAHGDLGMVTRGDTFIAISNSGETAELMAIVPIIKRMGATLIAMTGDDTSSLAQLANVHLNVGVDKEACTLNLAPTASTTAALAMGDALAVSLLDARGFREEDFARSHPGGALGRRLLTHVRDVMRSGADIPAVAPQTSLHDALLEISNKGMGMTAVVDADFKPVGIFTDGDLRRLIGEGENFSQYKITEVMHAQPRTVGPDQLAVDAVQVMERFRINQMLVTDADGVLVGALHIHDLTRAKVI